MSNKATDFIHPVEIIGDGKSNALCEITLKPHLATNKNTVYYGLNNGGYTGSYSTAHSKVGPGSYVVSVPASWFNRDNSVLVIEINTNDSNNKFVSGSYAHSMLLYNPGSKYKNYVSNFLYPTKTIHIKPWKSIAYKFILT